MECFSHPKNVCLTYIEHFKFSMYLSYEFALALVAAVVHAFYPDALVTYSSDTVERVTKEMKKIGCHQH